MEKLKKVSPLKLCSLLRLQNDPNLALELFLNPNPTSDSKPKPFRYSIDSFDLIISKLGRAKMFNELEQILEKLKSETRLVPKEVIFCNIITFYGRGHLPERAIQTFETIPSFGSPRTIKSANTVLNALLTCREFEKMREFFLGMDEYADPDACTYNILMNACCLRNDLDSAWKVFDEMKKREIQPNAVSFGTLINALCVNSNLDEALKLKETMVRVFQVKPNSYIYASLIKLLCKRDELDLAFKLKDEMVNHKVHMDSAVYTSLISALFKVGRRGDAIALLDEMRRNGCKPDTVTYNAVISGFCQENEFGAACSVLDEMEKKHCKPDVVSYNVIISAFCKAGNLRKAKELVKDMSRRNCVPDVLTYRIIFDGLCSVMHFKDAAFLLDDMILKGYAPRAESITKMLEHLCQNGKVKLLVKVLSSLEEGHLIDAAAWRVLVLMVCKKDELSNSNMIIDALTMF